MVRIVQAGKVFMSDPVTGAVTISIDEFSKQYTGKALAIWKPGAPLPKSALLARPYAPIDPSTIIGGAGAPYFFPVTPLLGG